MTTWISPEVTTTCMNFACYLSMHHCVLLRADIIKTRTQKYTLKFTFILKTILKIKNDFNPAVFYITPENLAFLMERVRDICDRKCLDIYHKGKILGGMV